MSHSISQSNEKSLVQFDYEKAVSNYLGTQSTFNSRSRRRRPQAAAQRCASAFEPAVH